MFHSLKKTVQKLTGLMVYIYESKLIYISVIFIIVIYSTFLLLRNNYALPTIGLFYSILLLTIIISVHISIRKRIKEGNFLGRDVGTPKEKIAQLVKICIFSSLPMIVALLYGAYTLNREKNVSDFETGFTTSSTSSTFWIVSEPNQKHSSWQLEVKPLQDVDIGGRTLAKKGVKMLLKTEPFREFEIGMICTVSGTLVEPKNSVDFDYKNFLKNKDIYFLMEYPKIECSQERKGFLLRRNLVKMKKYLINIVEKYLKEPQSSLFVGILFGQERLFSKTFEKNIRIAGVSHIVAASGYNVTILLIVLNGALRFFPKKVRIVFSVIVIWCFCLLSGVSPSIVRACIMASISLLGMFLGRKGSIHTTFFLCILIFVIFKPKILFDVGFQLSVCATAGLIYVLPSITKALKMGKDSGGFFKDTVLTTLSCTLATLPISILTFKTFSLWSVLANTLILPVVESTMLFGSLAMLFSSKLLFLIVNAQLEYVEMVVNIVGQSGIGYWDLLNGRVVAISLTVFLLLFCIYFYPVDDESSNYYLKIYS